MPPPKTNLQELVDADLAANPPGPKTAIDVIDGCEGDYLLASNRIYARTERSVSINTLRNWHLAHRAAAAAPA